MKLLLSHLAFGTVNLTSYWKQFKKKKGKDSIWNKCCKHRQIIVLTTFVLKQAF